MRLTPLLSSRSPLESPLSAGYAPIDGRQAPADAKDAAEFPWQDAGGPALRRPHAEGAATAAPAAQPDAAGAPEPRPLQRTCWDLRALASAPARAELQRRLREHPAQAPLWRQHLARLDAHAERLGTGEALRWAVGNALEPLELGRRWAIQRVFPSAAMFGGMLDIETLIEPIACSDALEPFAAMTADHVLLDGTWMRASRRQRALAGTQPAALVVVPGNGTPYESLLPWAETMRDAFNVDLCLFNYRGVGRSLGQLGSTQHAVLDTQAAIREAQRRAPRVGVLGISIGGGCGVAAIAGMQDSGELGPRGVDLFAALHTFRSLSAVLAAHFGPRRASASMAALRLLGIADLDSAGAMQTHRLAERTWIIDAVADAVIPVGTRLSDAPLPTDAGRMHFPDVGRFHHDPAHYFQASTADALSSWLRETS